MCALQFDPSAYGQAYQQGQEVEQENKYRNLQGLLGLAQQLGQTGQTLGSLGLRKQKSEQDKKLYEMQLADAQRKQKEEGQQDIPYGQLLSQEAISKPVTSFDMIQNQLGSMNIPPTPMPTSSLSPRPTLMDQFRNFQAGGKLRAPQMEIGEDVPIQGPLEQPTMGPSYQVEGPQNKPDISSLATGMGIPQEFLQYTPRQMSTMKPLFEAKKYAAAGESDYYTPEQAQAVASGDPASLAKAFGPKIPKSAVQQTYNIKNREGALDLRQQQIDMKEQLRQEKEAMQLGGLKSQADIVINKVDQALKKVSGFSAGGMAGTQNIPFVGQMTGATDLAADIDTIKAILGFSQLTEMRKASPTGGALGQVSDRELKLLTSAVASLDQAQSPEQLSERLGEIKTRYQNWLSAVSGVNPDIQGQSIQPVPGEVKPKIQRNKRTGQQRQSFDGGRTWQPM